MSYITEGKVVFFFFLLLVIVFNALGCFVKQVNTQLHLIVAGEELDFPWSFLNCHKPFLEHTRILWLLEKTHQRALQRVLFLYWTPAPSLTCSFSCPRSSGAKPGCTGNFRVWMSTSFIHVLQGFLSHFLIVFRSTWCQQLSELLSFLFILRPGKGRDHCSVKLPVVLTVTWKNYGMKKFSPESGDSAPGPS